MFRMLIFGVFSMRDALAVAVRDTRGTKVAVGLAGRAAATEQDRVLAGRSLEGELVKGDGLTAGLKDPLVGGRREAKSADLEGRDLVEADVVRDGADHDGRLALLGLHLLRNLGQRERRAVHAAHKETLEDDLVKVRRRPAREEPVELRETEVMVSQRSINR